MRISKNIRNSGLGFGKTRRLLNSADFRRVFRQRKKIGTRQASLHVAKNSLGHARLGITVSKKVSKSAVKRNRIKRLVREYFRHNHQRLYNTDIIFTAYPGCASLANTELAGLLNNLFKRAEKQCEQSSSH